MSGASASSFSSHDLTSERHCEPDAVAYTAMISSCAKRDMVEKALNLFGEMRKNGAQPTHVTYGALLHCCGRSLRLYHNAFDLFAEMPAVAAPVTAPPATRW